MEEIDFLFCHLHIDIDATIQKKGFGSGMATSIISNE